MVMSDLVIKVPASSFGITNSLIKIRLVSRRNCCHRLAQKFDAALEGEVMQDVARAVGAWTCG